MSNPQLSFLSGLTLDANASLAALFTCFVCFIAYVLFQHRDGRALGTRPRPDLATVPGIPILGNLLHFLKHGDRHMEMVTALRAGNKDRSKTFSVTLLGLPSKRYVDITKPSASQWLEYVQRTNFANYRKGPRVYNAFHDILGEGIFGVDGEAWMTQRKATSKIFTSANFRGFITDAIHGELVTLKAILSRYADSGKEFDLADLFFRFTLESFGLMAFGTQLGALSLESDAPVPFAQAFDYAQGVINNRMNNPIWKLTERFTGDGRKMAEASKTLDEFAFKIIQQREREGLGNITRDDKKDAEDLLSLYMALRDENGKPLSKRALRDSVMNLIIAGRDTTAQALAWTFFHLLSHPELLAPLRAEADKVPVVEFDNYKTMTQTQAAFHEGLRLHPAVPKSAWQAIGNDKLPDDGPLIYAGEYVLWSDWEMGRFAEVWGPDAKDFKPSRWIDDKQELKKESQFKFHAFNGGYRLCLGQNLAIYEATSVLASITRDYDLTFAPGYLENVEMVNCEKTPRYRNSITLPMAAPLLVTVSRRNNSPAS